MPLKRKRGTGTWYRNTRQRLSRRKRPIRRRFGRRRSFRRYKTPYDVVAGIPNKKKVVFKYVNNWVINPASGSVNKARYVNGVRCNDLFDPCAPESGTDWPTMYKQWMTFFHFATVTSAVMTVTFTSVREANDTMRCGVYRSSINGTPTGGLAPFNMAEDIDILMMDARQSPIRHLSPGSSTTIRLHFNARREWGQQFIIGDSRYRSNTVVGPTEKSIWIPWVSTLTNPTDGVNDQVFVQCKVWYTTHLTERRSIEPHQPPSTP
ncbi:MAG: putative capsid protein [Cressdnaviricota sp.]|nr:MAG: putative capsid protein [Cressdnaviricota sp.]